MRILYLTGHYPPDLTSGATLQVQRLAAAAMRAGHEVRVMAGAHRAGLTDGSIRSEMVDGIPVDWIGTAGWIDQACEENWWNPAVADAVGRLLDTWRPDVVHAHALQTLGADALAEASNRGIRTVVTMHDFWWVCARLFLVDRELRPCALVPELGGCECARSAGWRHEREWQLQQVLCDVDVVLAPSQAVCDVLAANGISAQLDPNDVERTEPSTDQRGSNGTPRGRDEDVRFVYMGGPNPLKGADVVRAAADALRHDGGWHLTVYGLEGSLGPRATTMPPFDPSERDAVLGQADVLLLPSIARESFSLAAREALQAGIPVVTSDCLGPQEVVLNEVNGLVVPTGDVAAMVSAMRRLVEDRALLGRLTDGARGTSIPTLDADSHFAHLLEHYNGTSVQPPSERSVLVVAGAAESPTFDEGARSAARLENAGWDVRLARHGDANVADLARDAKVTLFAGDERSSQPDIARVAKVAVRARPTPRVRIVIVNYRGRDLTLRCLQHVDRLTYPRERYEVVVVDNDSHDGLVEILRTERTDVRLVVNDRNVGFGAGCNAGIQLDGPWDAIALINNDSIPHPGWLDALVNTWFAPPSTEGPVGAVAGKVLFADTNVMNSAGCDLLEGGFNGDRGDGNPDIGMYDQACEVFGWTGAGALLTREMIEDIGVFDERFFLYYEDVDMVWRARRRGWSIAYSPDAMSEHEGGASAGRGDAFRFHDSRNRLFLLARHAPLSWFARATAQQIRKVFTRHPQPRRGIVVRTLWSLVLNAPRLTIDRRRLARRATVDIDRVIAWRKD